MLKSILTSDLMKLIKHSRFVKIAVTVGLGLTLTLATQAYYVFTAGQEGSSDEQANTTLQVNVGEMYFEQVDSELPRGLLAAKIGDVVEFTNVGNLRHSVTIEALDFDQIINPGETATLVVDKEVDRVQVYCRFHDNHEAILTVTANGGSTVQRTSPISEDADTSDLPVYSHEDAIDKLAYTEVDGVKEFHLTAEHFMWEYAEGHVLESWLRRATTRPRNSRY